MGKYFYIENTAAPEVMSPKELLALPSEAFEQYELSETAEDYEKVMTAPISDFGEMLIGLKGLSGRGFVVSYNEGETTYDVRAFTPATLHDWEGCLAFVKSLAKHLGTQELTDEGDEVRAYDTAHIDYDYREDIASGIALFEQQEADKEILVYGVYSPVVFNEKYRKALLEAEDRVGYFSRFIESLQHTDAYDADLNFYEIDGALQGFYSLIAGDAVLLPYTVPPFIDPTRWDIKTEEVKQWNVVLATINPETDRAEIVETISYEQFLAHLPEDKKEELDGAYMRVLLTEEEVRGIAASC